MAIDCQKRRMALDMMGELIKFMTKNQLKQIIKECLKEGLEWSGQKETEEEIKDLFKLEGFKVERLEPGYRRPGWVTVDKGTTWWYAALLVDEDLKDDEKKPVADIEKRHDGTFHVNMAGHMATFSTLRQAVERATEMYKKWREQDRQRRAHESSRNSKNYRYKAIKPGGFWSKDQPVTGVISAKDKQAAEKKLADAGLSDVEIIPEPYTAFRYEAMNHKGQPVKGELMAHGQDEALKKLNDQYFVVTKLQPK